MHRSTPVLAVLALACASLAVLAPSEARATDYSGFVCSVRHNPADANYPSGYVYFTLYSQPSCGGTLVRGLTLCSQSTTGGLCQVPAVFAQMYDGLMRAMATGLRVNVSDTYPLGSYAYILEFRAP